MFKIFFHFEDGHSEEFFSFGDTVKLQQVAKDWWARNGEVARIAHGVCVAVNYRPASGEERMPIVDALKAQNAL